MVCANYGHSMEFRLAENLNLTSNWVQQVLSAALAFVAHFHACDSADTVHDGHDLGLVTGVGSKDAHVHPEVPEILTILLDTVPQATQSKISISTISNDLLTLFVVSRPREKTSSGGGSTWFPMNNGDA